MSIDETTSVEDINALICLFVEVVDGMAPMVETESEFDGLWALDEAIVREVDYMQQDIFKKYHTETEMMRYYRL